jgi:hypothetical protein
MKEIKRDGFTFTDKPLNVTATASVRPRVCSAPCCTERNMPRETGWVKPKAPRVLKVRQSAGEQRTMRAAA